MPTYRTISRAHEDGYGEVVTLVVASDTYAGLYASSGQVDVGVLTVDTVKRDLDQGENILVEDEMSLLLDEATIETSDDADAIAFVLDARDIAVRRYVAVFLQPADVDAPVVADLDYSGLVRPETSSDDLQWNGAPWSGAIAPLRSWKVTIKNLFEGVLDRISMWHLIYGNGISTEPDYVPGISPSWESTNVSELFAYNNSGGYETRWQSMVNLNTLLRMLADEVEFTLDHQGYGTYTFELANSPLGVKAAPAEFVDHYAATPMRNAAEPYQITWLREKEIALGDGVNVLNQIWINYGRVKPDSVLNLPGITGDAHAFEKLESFADLLYKLAFDLGCYLRIEYITATTLRISFVPRANIVADEIWIRDAVDASLDLGPEQADESDTYYGMAHTLASEGNAASQGHNYYEHGASGLGWVTSPLTQELTKSGGEQLQFTIAPTMRRVKATIITGWSGAALPHNTRTYKSGVLQTGEERDTTGVTTALFMNGHVLPGTHVMPIAALRLTVDGTPSVYYSLGEYINAIAGRDKEYYVAEYQLRIPFLCSFRISADGSHAGDDGGRGSWKHLQLGRKLTLDGVPFAIVGYERNYAEFETTLRLMLISRFAFGEDTTSIGDATISVPAAAAGVAQYDEYTCGEDVDEGDAVSIMTDGTVYRTLALRSHFGRYVGIAQQDGLDGERIRVQTGGQASHTAWSLTPGAPVVVRTVAIGTPNVSASVLTGITATEDTYLRIGVAVSTTEFVMGNLRQFVYAPGLPV